MVRDPDAGLRPVERAGYVRTKSQQLFETCVMLVDKRLVGPLVFDYQVVQPVTHGVAGLFSPVLDVLDSLLGA